MTTSDNWKWLACVDGTVPEFLRNAPYDNSLAAHSREAKEESLRKLLERKQNLEASRSADPEGTERAISELDLQIAELSFEIVSYDNDLE